MSSILEVLRIANHFLKTLFTKKRCGALKRAEKAENKKFRARKV